MYFEMDCPCKGKYLDKMLQPGILNVLKEGKMHGFLLVQKLGENPMFAGNQPDKAGVYRYLKKMEESGLLESEWEFEEGSTNPRRIYGITEHGRECLQNWSQALKFYVWSLSRLVEEIDATGKTEDSDMDDELQLGCCCE